MQRARRRVRRVWDIPAYRELYAFHVMYESRDARAEVEAYLDTYFMCEKQERIPTEPVAAIKNPPDIWRYFVAPHTMRLNMSGLDEAEYVMRHVFRINKSIDGAFVASSGKDMGAFKGVRYPEDIGAFYRLDEYRAWAWTAHGRFPHQHARLVGRRASVHAAELVGRP